MFASTQVWPSFSVPNRLLAPLLGARAACLLVLTLLAAFLLAPPGVRAQNAGSLTILHGFLGSDGAFPNAPLVQGGDGNFYGTTDTGGATGNGTVFRVTPAGVYTLLYSFTGGSDGTGPNGGLVQGSDGNFYGTTSGDPYFYSNVGNDTANSGTVFKITSAGVLTTLYSFTGGDGLGPNGGLVQGSDGNFYGTTEDGGANDVGSVFQVTPAGALTTLYSLLLQL